MTTFYSHSVVTARGNLPRLVRELEVALEEGLHERMQVPLREVVSSEQPRAAFLSMPAVSKHFGLYINKVATIFERSATDPLPTVNAVVTAFSTRTGELLAMLDGAAVTNLKCAAVSALVTDRCARTDARVLAIAGTGVQARQQAVSVCAVRPIQEVRLWARNASRCAAFASELRASLGQDVRVITCESLDVAVRNADVIGTATSSKAPLGRFADLSPTVHINCMGGHTTETREVPLELLRTSTLIVEDLATAVAEAGPVHASALSLGQLVRTGRESLRAGRTVFSSTGHAFLDVITTAHLLRELEPHRD
ncbi:ornithine cyclodeaminase family protein [Corallococcus llansteffanensis]|uniref:Ornithine cyclodeaminase family protein n=1 Tax=Corallococcus llansteffanensis TaxID=2316731 RepID=A0A3A8PYG9_9BACT|nr:ornithine cyclodeaminase family protein [Corallococcus llansteffanensis]RKH61393.1 ornithine cyclodeaminase family protein [Corallococcus llansteffanensis]